jgi:nucleoside-diphosphate-sugar epimerase
MALSLVVGGAGFIGSHLVEALLGRGHTVRVLDDFRTGRLANLGGLPTRVEVYWGDLADPDLTREALAGVTRVFHLAASVQPAALAAGRRFLAAARQAGVARVVATVPADALEFDSKAETPPGLDVVWIRTATVLGPRFTPVTPAGHALSRAIDAMLRGARPAVPDGAFSLIDVADVVAANLIAAEAPEMASRRWSASGGTTLWRDVIDILNRLLGTNAAPVRGGPALEEPRTPSGAESVVGAIVPIRRSLASYIATRHANESASRYVPNTVAAVYQLIPA